MKRKLLLEFDLAQAEAVAVAAYCGDSGMKKLFGPCFASNFINGKQPEKIDCHLDRAIMILDVMGEHYEYKEFKAMYIDGQPRPKQMRQAAKAVGVHATNYDVGPRTVITSLRHHDIFLTTAQEAQLRYNTHTRFPGIKMYQTGVQRELNKTRTLKTAKGMKRYFFSKLDANTYRRAYAFLPQCTVAEITNEAIVAVDAPIRELNGFILLQVHDSILLEIPERHMQTAYNLVRAAMVQPIEVFPFFGESDIMTIQVDCKWGTHWGSEMKDWK